ncbi:cell cycle histidine kinase CckA [Asticcacaulis sp. 201]|uniref:cell cycle histidine kinase CckA n=1 Tax=Asticcacaulis sp. 201 TaxID=3028787 RepID=UPI002915DD91|nr:ATP-binding protein [Asticcacaulis sp. 201]MDV6330536.1 ATP-binding protein [Asticcacaulis sp. 201]
MSANSFTAQIRAKKDASQEESQPASRKPHLEKAGQEQLAKAEIPATGKSRRAPSLTKALNPLTVGIVAAVVVCACLAVWLVAGRLPAGVVIGIIIAAFAGVIFMGMFAFSSDEEILSAEGFKAGDIVRALSEPAAVSAFDGHVLAVNPAWSDAGGGTRRLPHGDDAPALFVALREAKAQGLGRALVRLGGFDYEMVVSRLGEDLVLVRAASQGVLGNGLMLKHENPHAVEEAGFLPDEPEIKPDLPAAVMDAFAEAAPFGAALIVGDDVFSARIKDFNTVFAALTEQVPDRLTGMAFGELVTENSRAALEERLASGKSGPFDIALSVKSQRALHIYVSQVSGGYSLYLFDVSEQKKLEQTLVQSQKMQAIGQVAGGMAHDFNNLLTGFKFRNDQLLLNHPLGDPSYEDLNGIRQIIARAEDLVRNLLAFARKQTVKRVTLNVGEMVSEAEVLLRRLVREDVKLETAYGRNLPNVHVDKGQMEMVMMNLVVNARDAMRAQGGGKVNIRAASMTQDEAKAYGWPDAPAQGAALIEVSDTGPGIPPEIAAQVFEPFFTTKPLGEGTGLGLSTVHGIIAQAGGHILIVSPPGKGASFRIFLPVWIEVEKPADAPKPEVAAKPVPKDLSGVGRILFVEDEQIVRGIAAHLLRQRGYEVLEAEDGEQALEIIEAEGGKFDLLISDVIMPGMDGPSMLKLARPILGDVPVMFISGYAESEFSDLLEEEQNISFLPKPLDIKTLAERVKAQLAA